MRIDGEKSQLLLPVLMAAALGISTVGCRGSANLEPAKPAVVTSTPAVLPDICLTPSELLRPPSLSRESVITYPGGVIVNQTGEAMELSVNIPTLLGINSSPDLALNFTPDTQNITYFFAGSFRRLDARERILEFIERDKPYLLYRYCQEQGVASGRARFSMISVADELREVLTNNPRNYLPTDPFWRRALEVQLTLAYVARTKMNTGDPEQVAVETPSLSYDERIAVVSLGFPFFISKFNPDYFTSVGELAPPSFN